MNKFEVGERYQDKSNKLTIKVTSAKSNWIEYEVINGINYLKLNGFSSQCAFARRLEKVR